MPSSPTILPFPEQQPVDDDPIVITGIGLATCLGGDRESVWQAIQQGVSGIRLCDERDPVGPLRIPCGMIDWLPEDDSSLKSIRLTQHVAKEALADAEIPWDGIDRTRFACSISAQFGDIRYCYEPEDTRDTVPESQWWNEFLPCSVTSVISNEFQLYGPRLCHTTACASGLVSTLAGIRALKSDQADFALCGAADAIAHLVISAFNRMGVLSHGPNPAEACRPFDKNRSGFVMGEGASLMVLEKRSHALARGATIYSEISACATLCQAHHVTGLDGDAECLTELINQLVRKSGWQYKGPQYINAHGTGTLQNDASELKAIRYALGDQADDLVMSSNKAVQGHLINAAGSAELAITALALRDGYAPPTMHLENPEDIGNLDCLPMYGEQANFDRALKLSLAFGGHLVGMGLRRSPFENAQRDALPLNESARIRSTPNVATRRAAA